MNIQIAADDIISFDGDAIIVPCDSELSYTKSFSPNPNYPLFNLSMSLKKAWSNKFLKRAVKN